MKKLLLSLISLVSMLTMFGKEMSIPMAVYRDGCIKMGQAIANHDRYLMYDAKDLFAQVNLSSFDDVEPADDSTAFLQKAPTILFTPEYADTLLINDFTMIELDPANMIRKGEGSLYLMHHTIPGGTTLSYKACGIDDCEMIVVTLPGHQLSLNVTNLSTGENYEGIVSGEGCASWVRWQMSTMGEYLFKIKNEGTSDAPFVVAVN